MHKLSLGLNILIWMNLNATQQYLYGYLLLVSHTTDDLVFQWEPNVPLVVDENIELPQLQLVQNKTADCTQVYSTGVVCILFVPSVCFPIESSQNIREFTDPWSTIF